MEYETMDYCDNVDACRNKDNSQKCFYCSWNKCNYESIKEYELNGTAHDRHNKKYYRIVDHYDPE